ncbi:lysozyme inhibitor LprI family protein [Roseobacteraceae bacterium NS-SX3]
MAFSAAADPSLECSGAGSQVEIGTCLAADAQRVEEALAVALDIARDSAAELDEVTGRASALPALEQSQSAWTGYRDAHCEAVGASFGGGSGTGIAIQSCRISLGRARVEQLISLGR